MNFLSLNFQRESWAFRHTESLLLRLAPIRNVLRGQVPLVTNRNPGPHQLLSQSLKKKHKYEHPYKCIRATPESPKQGWKGPWLVVGGAVMLLDPHQLVSPVGHLVPYPWWHRWQVGKMAEMKILFFLSFLLPFCCYKEKRLFFFRNEISFTHSPRVDDHVGPYEPLP